MNQQPNTKSGLSAEYPVTPEMGVDAGRVALLRGSILPTILLVRQGIGAVQLGAIAGVPRPDEAQIDR